MHTVNTIISSSQFGSVQEGLEYDIKSSTCSSVTSGERVNFTQWEKPGYRQELEIFYQNELLKYIFSDRNRVVSISVKTVPQQKKNVYSFIYEFFGFLSCNTDPLENAQSTLKDVGQRQLLGTSGRMRSALRGQKRTLQSWRPL